MLRNSGLRASAVRPDMLGLKIDPSLVVNGAERSPNCTKLEKDQNPLLSQVINECLI